MLEGHPVISLDAAVVSWAPCFEPRARNLFSYSYSPNKRNFENRTVSRLLGVILEAQILSLCTKPLRTRLGCCGTARRSEPFPHLLSHGPP